MDGVFAAILFTTTRTKTTKKRHGVTQKADGINTIPVKHQNAPADKFDWFGSVRSVLEI